MHITFDSTLTMLAAANLAGVFRFRRRAHAPSASVAKAVEAVESAGPLTQPNQDPLGPLGALAKLPPFRPVVLSLLRLFDRDDVSIADATRLVQSDPAVVTEILALVNSPLFAVPGTIANAGHALSLLGMERTRSVVSTLAMRAMMANAPKTPVVRRFWTHSVATATIAQHVAATFGVSKDLAYVAAIMHDLGRMGLLSAHDEAYTQLALASQESAAAILVAESAALGMDHCQAGLLLAESWALPTQLHGAVGHHHEAPLKDRSLESVVQASCRLADALHFQAILHRDASTPEATIESTVPEALQESVAGQLDAIQTDVLNTIQTLDY